MSNTPKTSTTPLATTPAGTPSVTTRVPHQSSGLTKSPPNYSSSTHSSLAADGDPNAANSNNSLNNSSNASKSSQLTNNSFPGASTSSSPLKPSQLLKDWDKLALLSDEQNETFVKIQAIASRRPVPQRVTWNYRVTYDNRS